jgi:hypothetical protein
MNAARYRACLELLGISAADLARKLGCSDRLTYRWTSGKVEVPVGIGRWLEAWVAVRLAHPDPLPPDDWHPPPGG